MSTKREEFITYVDELYDRFLKNTPGVMHHFDTQVQYHKEAGEHYGVNFNDPEQAWAFSIGLLTGTRSFGLGSTIVEDNIHLYVRICLVARELLKGAHV